MYDFGDCCTHAGKKNIFMKYMNKNNFALN